MTGHKFILTSVDKMIYLGMQLSGAEASMTISSPYIDWP